MKSEKRLLYVVRYPLYAGFHLKQKFDGQIKAFNQLGYQTLFIAFDKKHFYLLDGEKKTVIGNTHFILPNYYHTFIYTDIYKAVIKVARKVDIDIVYYREAPIFARTLFMMQLFRKQNCRIIQEIPTYTRDIKENELSFFRKIFKLYSNIWAKRVKTLPSLYVFIGDGNLNTFCGVPAVRIENGIDPDLMPTREPINDKESIHILALSSMSYWHGYDRLIKSLAEYTSDKKVIIHMVGNDDGGCMADWKRIVKNHGLENKVIFHGALYGRELDDMFNLCDIGINSMGMYRKGFEYTSELKNREYISRGLPFVSSVYDVVLDGLDKDLWYEISNDDSIPSMDGIIEFALRVKQNDTCKDRLHEYAVKNMTWKVQYKKVFDCLEGVI